MKFTNKKFILIAGLGVIILGAIILFIIFKFRNTATKIDLESEMKTLVSSFYDKNIKGKIVGVHKQIVTLQTLQEQDYDINNFIEAKCSLESFSYVILDNPNETNIDKIKYEIENHLDCENNK